MLTMKNVAQAIKNRDEIVEKESLALEDKKRRMFERVKEALLEDIIKDIEQGKYDTEDSRKCVTFGPYIMGSVTEAYSSLVIEEFHEYLIKNLIPVKEVSIERERVDVLKYHQPFFHLPVRVTIDVAINIIYEMRSLGLK